MKKLTLLTMMSIAAGTVAAQTMSVCYGNGYILNSKADAVAASGEVNYSWYEDGDLLDGENASSLTFAAGKALGTYAYWRMAAGEDCPDGVPSNIFTVTVNPVPAIHTASQTVNQGTPISTILYIASDGATISMTGSLPPGVTSAVNGSSYTISGTPTGTGTFGYALISTTEEGCASAVTAGTITVTCGGGMTKPPGAVSEQMWCYGTQTWSDRIAAAQPSCASAATLSTVNPPPAQYKIYNDNGVDRYYYNWVCVNAATTTLCPYPWRVPVVSDLNALNASGSALMSAWGLGGSATGNSVNDAGIGGCYWSSTQAQRLCYVSNAVVTTNTLQSNGFQVRCVR
jgi:hypothetical protein